MAGTEYETPADAFEDPLSNYDPIDVDDPLEKALMSKKVPFVRNAPFLKVRATESIESVLQRMRDVEGVACALVMDGDQIIGIFGERDVLDRVALSYAEIKNEPISEVMSPQPVYVSETGTVAAALCVMADHGYRHIPVLNASDEVTGMVTPRRISAFLRDVILDRESSK